MQSIAERICLAVVFFHLFLCSVKASFCECGEFYKADFDEFPYPLEKTSDAVDGNNTQKMGITFNLEEIPNPIKYVVSLLKYSSHQN